MRRLYPILWLAAGSLGLLLAAPHSWANASVGRAVAGADSARILPPAGAVIEGYENVGYRLVRRGDEVEVLVDTSPLESTASFTPTRSRRSRRGAEEVEREVERLARGLTTSSQTVYEASSKILDWVSRHIEYDADREQSQAPGAVLARQRAYCTGIARLTVALLKAAGLEAREVPGWVAGEGYHRWVEIYLPDRGWVFSDPLRSHHYVPASYVRLAGNELVPELGLEGLLVSRDDRIHDDDLVPSARTGIRVRRNKEDRVAAALHVRVEDQASGWAVLQGTRKRYVQDVVDGRVSFIGLPPGRYHLHLLFGAAPSWVPRMEHQLELVDLRPAFVNLGLADLRIEKPRAAFTGVPLSKRGERKR